MTRTASQVRRRAPLQPGELSEGIHIGASLALPARVSHYLGEVLRMKPGEPVELFDGSGRVVRARILHVEAGAMQVEVLEDRVELARESPCMLTLVQAIPKGKKFDLVLEKATELGVARIIPLETTRTVVQISASREAGKVERWERIVEEAARQCGRTRTPEVLAPMGLKAALELLQGTPSLVAHTAPGIPSLRAALQSEVDRDSDTNSAGDLSAVAVWVGPEGGFDASEIEQLCAHGARQFHLGPRVLRTETAGLVGLTLLQAEVGDLG